MVAEKAEIALVMSVEAANVPLADPREVALHLGLVVVSYPWWDSGVGHQICNASSFQDIRGIALQGLVVTHHVV